jgi:hypothetical protein
MPVSTLVDRVLHDWLKAEGHLRKSKRPSSVGEEQV